MDKQKYIQKILKLAGEIAFIFGVPAVLAAVFGPKLDAHFASGREITVILFISAFGFSWGIFIKKYLKIIKGEKKN